MKKLMQTRRDFIKLIGVGSGTLLCGGGPSSVSLAAETYPSRRTTWINPTKPGGGSDVAARLVARYLGKYLKSSPGAKNADVVLKNIPVAGGINAYSTIFFSKPDGYTIGDFNNAFVTDSILSKLDFDINKFTYIVRTGVNTHLILAKKGSFRTWDEMMQAGKKKELKLGTSSFGHSAHVSCILIKEAAKMPIRIINFPGAAETVNALLRGDVQVIATSETTAKALIDAGELRPLAVLDSTSKYPDAPTIAQLGYPELTGPLGQHRLVIGPPNLPREVTNVLISAFKKTFKDEEFLAQAKLIAFDIDPLYGADVDQMVKKLFKYYEELTPTLRKYLQ